ncbi:MAG: hypothetical protein EOM87_08570 [Clostridia bacterium]|nr:hypothetical protein [Clostridia bacterium]
MKVNPNYTSINVEANIENNDSIFAFYKKLIKFRLNNQIIIEGNYKEYYPKHKDLFVYERSLNNESLLIICNFKNKDVPFNIPDSLVGKKHVLELFNYDNISPTIPNKLRPYEALVYKILG